MTVWTGATLRHQLQLLRTEIENLSESLESHNLALLFPMHMSLRISFPIEESQLPAVLETIKGYLETQKPILVTPVTIEKVASFIWIRFKPTKRLDSLHEGLVRLLETKYGFPPQNFDQEFIFHSTLFNETNPEILDRAYEAIKAYPLPKRMRLESFVIGVSPDDQIDHFKILHEQNI